MAGTLRWRTNRRNQSTPCGQSSTHGCSVSRPHHRGRAPHHVAVWLGMLCILASCVQGSSMPTRGQFSLLGVGASASSTEVRKAYRRRARIFHPDKNPDDPDASHKFSELANAYEAVSEYAKAREEGRLHNTQPRYRQQQQRQRYGRQQYSQRYHQQHNQRQGQDHDQRYSHRTFVRRTTFIGPGGALLAFLAVVLVAVMFMCYSGKTNDGDAEPDQAGPASILDVARRHAPAALSLTRRVLHARGYIVVFVLPETSRVTTGMWQAMARLARTFARDPIRVAYLQPLARDAPRYHKQWAAALRSMLHRPCEGRVFAMRRRLALTSGFAIKSFGAESLLDDDGEQLARDLSAWCTRMLGGEVRFEEAPARFASVFSKEEEED